MIGQRCATRYGAFWISSARDRKLYSTMLACAAMAHSRRQYVIVVTEADHQISLDVLILVKSQMPALPAA
jgi:hypothetical protein